MKNAYFPNDPQDCFADLGASNGAQQFAHDDTPSYWGAILRLATEVCMLIDDSVPYT